MKILITGGTGLLGRALVASADNSYEIVCTFIGDYQIHDTKQTAYRKLNISDKEGYFQLLRDFRPEVTIHAAGISNPDYVERNNKQAWEINVGGTRNIVKVCEELDSKFIYISSNAIYGGTNAPYREEDKADPISYYGRIKLECEEITKESNTVWAIVRPILMYGWNYAFERPNIVTTGIARLRKKEKFFAYEDVYYNPLYYYSCAEAIWRIIEKNKFEVFNVAGKDRLSIYGLMKGVADVFNLEQGLLIPVQQGFFQEMVKRPSDTSYCTAKIESVLDINPLTVRAGLKLMRDEAGQSHE